MKSRELLANRVISCKDDLLHIDTYFYKQIVSTQDKDEDKNLIIKPVICYQHTTGYLQHFLYIQVST